MFDNLDMAKKGSYEMRAIKYKIKMQIIEKPESMLEK